MKDNYLGYIKNMGGYMLASLIPMLVNVITNPIFATFLSPKDYATIGYFTSFNTLFAPMIVFYMLHYYQKRYFELDEYNREQLNLKIFKLLLTFSAVLFFIAICIVAIYNSVISSSSLSFFPYGILALFPGFFSGIYSLYTANLRMKRNSGKYLKVSLVNFFITLFFSLLLVVVFRLGALGKMIGVIAGPFVFFIYLIYKNKTILQVEISKSQFKEIFKFCFPLTIAAMLSFFSSGYDRVFLEQKVSLSELGYYSVAVTIAGYITVFSTAINETFSPDIFQTIVSRNFKKCAKFITLQVALVSIIVCLFILLAPFLVKLLTAGRYTASASFAIIISLSAITSTIYYSVSMVTIALGYTKITLLNKIIGSILCVVSFSILISKWGTIGASWGLVISHLLFFIGNVIIVIIYKYKTILRS